MPKEKALNKKEVSEILSMGWAEFCKRVSAMSLRNLEKLFDSETGEKGKGRATYVKRLTSRISRERKLAVKK